jgi:hypothetical protein
MFHCEVRNVRSSPSAALHTQVIEIVAPQTRFSTHNLADKEDQEVHGMENPHLQFTSPSCPESSASRYQQGEGLMKMSGCVTIPTM